MTDTGLTFPSVNRLASVAALIGDPARANMLMALMAGQALTAGELAFQAGITAQTASGHLARLLDAGLLGVERQGRHRYYRLAMPDIAEVLETLTAMAASEPAARQRRIGPKDEALRTARTCYDHVAGRLGVAIADSLAAHGFVELAPGAATLTESGRNFLCEFGADLEEATARRRPLCRACLDWSERRHHLAGRLGAALLGRFLERGWLSRTPGDRTLTITRAGERGFAEIFGIARGPDGTLAFGAAEAPLTAAE